MAQRIIVTVLLCLWIYLDQSILLKLDFFQEKNLKNLWTILDAQPRQDWLSLRYRRLQKFRIFLVAVWIFPQVYLTMAVLMVILILVYKYPYWQLKHRAQLQINQVRYQFPIYLRQLQVLLQNNTVVKTIELSIEYVPDVMRKDILLLHQNLKEDPVNINHYLACMNQFNLPEIQRAMKWLYRYQSIGYQDATRQFNRMITSTSKWLRQSRLEHKAASVQVYQWLGLLPLVGVTLVFLSAMMSVALSLFERG